MFLRDFLLFYVDLTLDTLNFFDVYGYYKKPMRNYKLWREQHKIEAKTSYRFQKLGYLERDTNGDYLLSKKARLKLGKMAIENIKLKEFTVWDKKWRVIFFDIPETKKATREIFRKKLKELGFEFLQKSVFCYPHECLEEISMIIRTYEIEPYITYMEVTNIITGKNLIKIFAEKNIITS